MPKPFVGDLGMNSRGEPVSSIGVPEVMEADTGQFVRQDQAHPLMGDAAGLQRAAIGLCHHERLAVRADT